MLYHAYEMTHAAFSPMRAAARMGREVLGNPFNPMAATYGSRAVSAALEMFINATRRYGRPAFGIEETVIDGAAVPVVEEVALSRPFCNLLHFRREGEAAERRRDPRVLMVAPMSGHYATLLRGTVRDMLPNHDVYITDWTDAREVALAHGEFDLDDYTDHLIEMIEHLSQDGERIAVMAVCQPGIPVMAAAALMSAAGSPRRPASMVLMGSPMDTARNPKQPNQLASQRPLGWFENNVIVTVPWPSRGFLRRVYPGFLQLSSFLAMNADRHVDAHVKQFQNLVRGDGDGAEQHRTFYDEYMAVMDLPAEFYLQTIDRVFQRRLMANGIYRYRGNLLDTAAIDDVALMTIEGEKDDITGLGQTEAAHDMVPLLPETQRRRFVAEGVGHYGVFNGSRWRKLIEPQVRGFISEQRRSL
jgi:poly(3-hydroxybutyrate) depolymerase